MELYRNISKHIDKYITKIYLTAMDKNACDIECAHVYIYIYLFTIIIII